MRLVSTLLMLLMTSVILFGCKGASSGGSGGENSSALSANYKYFVYTANYADNTISSFLMNRDTGLLTPIESTSAGLGNGYLLSLVVNPSGDKLYVAKASGNDSSSNIQIFSIDKSTGALRPFQDFLVGASGQIVTGISFSLDGSLVFVTSADGNFKVYSVSSLTGKLILSKTTGVAGSTRSLMHPSGKYIFWAGSGGFTMWPINQTTGDITLVGAHTITMPYAETMVFSPDGNRLYVGSNGSGNINSYNLDLINGTASSLESIPIGSTSRGLAISNFGKTLIGVESNAGFLHSYLINQSSGILTEVDKKPTGAYPVHVAFFPDGKYALVTNSAGNSLSTFSVEESTGALKLVGTTVTGGGPLFTVVAKISQ